MSRKIQFETGGYYHIYNRGVDKREVFCDKNDYFNFLIRLRDFNNDSMFEKRVLAQKEPSSLAAKELGSLTPLVEIIAYCLNPNHYHLLIKQYSDKGIEKFMHKVGTGFTNYFNKKYARSGVLFQGKFKAVPIATDEQLLHISAYINGNAQIHGIADAKQWPYCSYQDYFNIRQGNLCHRENIISSFESVLEYKDFVDEVIKNSSEIKEEIKKCLME